MPQNRDDQTLNETSKITTNYPVTLPETKKHKKTWTLMVGRREKDRLRPIFIAKLAVKFRAGVYPIRFMCLIHLPVVDFVDLYEFHVGKYTIYIHIYLDRIASASKWNLISTETLGKYSKLTSHVVHFPWFTSKSSRSSRCISASL